MGSVDAESMYRAKTIGGNATELFYAHHKIPITNRRVGTHAGTANGPRLVLVISHVIGMSAAYQAS